MLLRLLCAWLLFLLPPVRAEDGGADIKQIDLVSGIPTLLVTVIAFIQILPSPVKVFEWRIKHFVEWLESSVETDFGMSLHTCTKRCHTYMYNGTEEAITSRVCANIGSGSAAGCTGGDLLTTEDVIGVVQRGSGESLVWLARICGYPHVRRLETAVRVLEYAPLMGRRVIIWQWGAMSLPYFFSWLFRHGLPQIIHSFFLFLRNLCRRALSRLPHEPLKLTVNYRMAQLAQHKTIDQHGPFVRYALYFVLLELANKSLSIRSFRDMLKPGESGVHRPAWADGDVEWREGNESEFKRAAVASRRIAQKVATDECSAARLIFSFCLHSIRVMALCQGGFAPAYVTSGSFSAVESWVEDTLLVISHSTIDAVYQRMLKVSARTHYNMLLKRLQSPLGDYLLRKRECIVLLNMALMPLNTADFSHSNMQGLCEVAGKQIKRELYQQLCKAQADLFNQINTTLLPSFMKPDIYWGPQIWLLNLLRMSISTATKLDSVVELRTKLKMLGFSLFQPRFVPSSNTTDKTVCEFSDLYERFATCNELDDERFCRSMPAWCMCVEHCRGICTLIVNELQLNIMVESYLYCPYVFTAMADPPKSSAPSSTANATAATDTPASAGRSPSNVNDTGNANNTNHINDMDNINDIGNTVSHTSATPINHINNVTDPAADCIEEPPNQPEADAQQHTNTSSSSFSNMYPEEEEAQCREPETQLARDSVSAGPSSVRLICINSWKGLNRDQYGDPNTNSRESAPARRFDLTHYWLSTYLYQDAPLIVVIYGDQLYTTKNNQQTPQGEWPYANYMVEEKEIVKKGRNICVDKAHNLVLDSVDPVALLASRRAYMSYGRLQFQQNKEMKNKVVLSPPFRNVSPT